MYKSKEIDKVLFAQMMEAIKAGNRKQKQLRASTTYKIGTYICDVAGAFRSVTNFKKYCAATAQKIRWKRVCKKYPIIHSEQRAEQMPNYFSDERFAVYTCIFGNYDSPQEPQFCPDNCDYYIITDQQISENTVWKVRDVSSLIPDFAKLSNVERNRFCKMLPHIVFPEYNKSIYIDGNVVVCTDLTEFIVKDMPYGVIFHNHKARKCVYEEIKACEMLHKAPREALAQYKTKLINDGFPVNYGMVECNVIVRDHSSLDMRQLMEQWWEDFLHHDVKRDQLCMPYLLWKRNIPIAMVNTMGVNVEENDAFYVVAHK